MFPKAARLLDQRAYAAVLTPPPSQNTRKRAVRGKHFQIYAQPNQMQGARLGMIVGKRVEPSAVKRNRCRRIIRETFRRMRADLPPVDFIVRLSARIEQGHWRAAKADLDAALSRAAAVSFTQANNR